MLISWPAGLASAHGTAGPPIPAIWRPFSNHVPRLMIDNLAILDKRILSSAAAARCGSARFIRQSGCAPDITQPYMLSASLSCCPLQARVYARSGDGGNGCVGFRREKFVEKGGPNGGNGGRGGNVWAVAADEQNSLFTFRNRPHWKAPSGAAGTGSCCHGADAEDLCIPVPTGEPPQQSDTGQCRVYKRLQPFCNSCQPWHHSNSCSLWQGSS